MAERLLVVDRLSKRFGGVHALDELSFEVGAGEVVGLIGPNGSGKSTCVNLVSGTLPPSSGIVSLAGQDLAGRSIDARVRLGLARTFQTTTLFPELTAHGQVLTACHTRFDDSVLGNVLRRPASRRATAEQSERAARVLEFVGLGGCSDAVCASLSSAQQRLLMVATALASEPRVVLLDEPAAGMVAHERRELAALIGKLRSRGIGVLVIEHHMGLIMEVCDRIVVLNFGRKIAEGTPAQIAADEAVVDAYLGQTHEPQSA